MIPLSKTEDGVLFHVRVVPRASRSELAGVQDDALKLRITAPPVDGKANEECIRVLADFFDVKKRQVTIVSGHASRTKTIAIAGKSSGEIAARLEKLPTKNGE
ncbi:MAG: DUF167 domain-containing protein [Syntrophobacterales bacterium]|nr:DUF167 domain-containing protein [Syntrophobacterales bacterium]